MACELNVRSLLLALRSRGRVQEAEEVPEAKQAAPHDRDVVLGKAHWQIHLRVERECDGRGSECEKGRQHELIRLVCGLPVKAGHAEEGTPAPTHGKIMPLVEVVATALEVLAHEKVWHERELQASQLHG